MARGPAGGNISRVTLSPQADRDRLAIYVYTQQQWGTGQAETYNAFLRGVMEQLSANPTIAPFAPGRKSIRVYSARWKPGGQGHKIFFRQTESGIFILRILHTAMNWPQHLGPDSQ